MHPAGGSVGGGCGATAACRRRQAPITVPARGPTTQARRRRRRRPRPDHGHLRPRRLRATAGALGRPHCRRGPLPPAVCSKRRPRLPLNRLRRRRRAPSSPGRRPRNRRRPLRRPQARGRSGASTMSFGRLTQMSHRGQTMLAHGPTASRNTGA